jgi:hypothetical protein
MFRKHLTDFFHGIFSMKFYEIFHGIPWNSMQFSMKFSMEFHGISWNSMEFHEQFHEFTERFSPGFVLKVWTRMQIYNIVFIYLIVLFRATLFGTWVPTMHCVLGYRATTVALDITAHKCRPLAQLVAIGRWAWNHRRIINKCSLLI